MYLLCGVVDIISLRVDLHHRCISIYIQGKIRKKRAVCRFQIELCSRVTAEQSRQWSTTSMKSGGNHSPPAQQSPGSTILQANPSSSLLSNFNLRRRKKKIFIHDAIPDILFTFSQSPYFCYFFAPLHINQRAKKQNKIESVVTCFIWWADRAETKKHRKFRPQQHTLYLMVEIVIRWK